MLQTKKERYDVKTLLSLNESYDYDHKLTEWDVDKVNNLVKEVESSRSVTKPKAGDRLLYTSAYGDYSPEAFIEKNRKGELFVCVGPMVPFVELSEANIYYDVSGGPFTGMHEDKLKYVGTVNNYFKTWGHSGACANGAVHFLVEVNMWEYIEPEPLYGDFTTKTWRKLFINKVIDPTRDYLYKGSGLMFRNEDEYQDFLNVLCGTEFPSYDKGQLVIWCYKEELKGVSQQEWNAIDAPVTSRKIGTLPTNVKVQKDHENHSVITFYVHPDEFKSVSNQ